MLKLQIYLSKIQDLIFTFANVFAISKVPTVSMFDAMIGIPLYVCLELRKVISL